MKYEEPNMLIKVFYGEDLVRTSNVKGEDLPSLEDVPGLKDERNWPT